MAKSVITGLCVIALAVSSLCGCAIFRRGPSDEELISNLLEDWKSALIAKEMDPLMTLYSENFSHYDWGNKDSFRQFLTDFIDDGQMNDAEVDLEEAQISIEDETATVYSIELSAVFGNATITLTLAKEEGAWLIVGLDAS